MTGATGFDREARVREACRVTAYPYPSGTKYNCRLSRVRTSCLRRSYIIRTFFPLQVRVWCHLSGIVRRNVYSAG